MKTLAIKSLLTSLCQREEWVDKLTIKFVILSLSKDGKEGEGRLFNNDTVLMYFLLKETIEVQML